MPIFSPPVPRSIPIPAMTPPPPSRNRNRPTSAMPPLKYTPPSQEALGDTPLSEFILAQVEGTLKMPTSIDEKAALREFVTAQLGGTWPSRSRNANVSAVSDLSSGLPLGGSAPSATLFPVHLPPGRTARR
ncbi:hypothetical protein R3P38DRAFT_3168281 [Favolaschia claudopus]|uniref:Uncharacterized protein n=1 Tax=Favolaschia claudopus TaxID=2862362 RepID=A0AAW0E9C1_9AGAR